MKEENKRGSSEEEKTTTQRELNWEKIKENTERRKEGKRSKELPSGSSIQKVTGEKGKRIRDTKEGKF